MSENSNNANTPLSPDTEGRAIAARSIEVITAEINFYKRQAGEAILEIGARLNEAKEQLDHGEWLGWLEEKVEFSEATAQRFMRLSREYSDPALVTELGTSKALALLALPPGDREEFLSETHDVGGEEKSASEMSKRELEAAVKERAAAIKAQKEAESIAAEAQRKLGELSKELAEVEARANKVTDYAEKKEKEIEELKGRMETLKASGDDLPDEDGQQMMEAIRKEIAAEAKKEAEEKLKKKIEQANLDKEKAERALKDAMDATGRINQEGEAVKRQQEERIAQLEKRLAAASSEAVTVFKTHFEGAQGCINSMIGCIMKLKGEPETQAKLIKALRALCEKTSQNLPATPAERPYGDEEAEESAEVAP